MSSNTNASLPDDSAAASVHVVSPWITYSEGTGPVRCKPAFFVHPGLPSELLQIIDKCAKTYQSEHLTPSLSAARDRFRKSSMTAAQINDETEILIKSHTAALGTAFQGACEEHRVQFGPRRFLSGRPVQLLQSRGEATLGSVSDRDIGIVRLTDRATNGHVWVGFIESRDQRDYDKFGTNERITQWLESLYRDQIDGEGECRYDIEVDYSFLNSFFCSITSPTDDSV